MNLIHATALRRLVGVLCAFFLALTTACATDPGRENNNDDDDTTTSTTTGPGGTGGGGSSTSTSTSTGTGAGGGDTMCHPNESNNWCEAESACECPPTLTSDDLWCENALSKGIDLCPEGVSLCTPGHNQCGFHLKKDEDYVASSCANFLDGNKWTSGGYESTFTATENAQGQLELHFGGLLGGITWYYNGFIVTGNKSTGEDELRWNAKNRDHAEFGLGFLSSDCKTLTIRFYEPGASDEQYYSEEFFNWVSH